MTLPANPHASKNITTTPAKAKSAKTLSSKTVKAVQTDAAHEPRSYFAMMLLSIVLLPTGLARAYRGENSGWTRFWIYVASNAIMIIPILGQLLGGVTILVLSIIGVFDVFTLRKTTTDAFGKPLYMTEKDKQWARGFYIYFIALLVLAAVMILLITTIIGTVLGGMTSGDGNFYDQWRSFEQQVPQQYVEPETF